MIYYTNGTVLCKIITELFRLNLLGDSNRGAGREHRNGISTNIIGLFAESGT